MVSAHDYGKFKETFDRHECVPRSRLYLADGYDIVRSYTDGLEIKEEKEGVIKLSPTHEVSCYRYADRPEAGWLANVHPGEEGKAHE